MKVMFVFILSFASFFIIRPVLAQDNNVISANVDGGMQKFYRYVDRQLEYPEEAKQKGVEGKVFVIFIVELDGSLSDIGIEKSLHPDCDAEALRIMETFNTNKKAPTWIPTKEEGEFVRSKMVIPILFKL